MRNSVLLLAIVFSSCSLYDNYDPDLMPGAVTIIESSSSSAEISSSSKKEEYSSSSEVSSSSETVVSSSEESSSSENNEPTSSSSSDKKSSSSSVEDSWVCGDSSVTHGGYEYRTVSINGMCFTAENMRKKTSSGKSICYIEEYDEETSVVDASDSIANCDKYGRLYNYEAAKHACPEKWRLPKKDELEAIVTYVDATYGSEEAGEFLKSETGWLYIDDPKDPVSTDFNPNGTDFFKFTALPGGYCIPDSDEGSKEMVPACFSLGTNGAWWSETELDLNHAYRFALTSDDATFSIEPLEKNIFSSVRCIKDK